MQAVEARYRVGLVDFGAVLQARQAVLQDQDQLAISNGELRRYLLSLYKALGGGWEGIALVEQKPGTAAAAYTDGKSR